MPSAEVGGDVRRNRALNCWPWVRSLTRSPDAVIHSPAAMVAAWPITVTTSRCPRARFEVLAGLVERVTYHNAENGFCVLRAKALSICCHRCCFSISRLASGHGRAIPNSESAIESSASSCVSDATRRDKRCISSQRESRSCPGPRMTVWRLSSAVHQSRLHLFRRPGETVRHNS
jgi:hypothetical protein